MKNSAEKKKVLFYFLLGESISGSFVYPNSWKWFAWIIAISQGVPFQMTFPWFYKIKLCLLLNLNFVTPHASLTLQQRNAYSLQFMIVLFMIIWLYSRLKVIHVQWKLYFEFLSFPGQAVCDTIVSHDAASGIKMILPVGWCR